MGKDIGPLEPQRQADWRCGATVVIVAALSFNPNSVARMAHLLFYPDLPRGLVTSDPNRYCRNGRCPKATCDHPAATIP